MKLNQSYPLGRKRGKGNFGGERKIYFKYISLQRNPAIRSIIAQ